VKEFKISVNGKEYSVEIDDPNASPVKVIVNGQAFTVALSEQRTSRTVSTVQSDVELDQVYVPTVTSTFVEMAVEQEETSVAQAALTPTEAVEQVTAPMPGKILDIAVKVGTPIKHGDTLCNLEAMKMKSPIRSTVDGTIIQVLISEGQNVNFGEVLFTLQ
jgi:glutaconyl-CoA/methylmalonyl-CoA decarboxylase subunit gamma